jgi:hypothetical protein
VTVAEAAAEIRDPLHGYIHLSELERAVIDTPVFQRLRRIRQLAAAYLAYPGAQHTRFEHSVGAMHLAGLAGAVLVQKGALTADVVPFMRAAALLHDVGHGPFSHLFEEVMTEKQNMTHEDMTQRIVRETEIAEVLGQHGLEANRVADMALGRAATGPGFVNDVLGGGLSVDILDYLVRDSYFTGVEYGKVDVHRVINSYEVVDDHLALDQAALYAFEAVLIARYEMFRAVYFHRTVRAADIMLVRAMQLADDKLHLTRVEDLHSYLRLTDDATLERLLALDAGGSPRLQQAREYAVGYAHRRLMKCVFERLVHRKEAFMERIFNQKKIREGLADEIAQAAHVDPAQVYVDVPTAPSVPFTAAREALESITLVTRAATLRSHQTLRLEELPLARGIAGFVDLLRIYTLPQLREPVEHAVQQFFGREGYMTKISV